MDVFVMHVVGGGDFRQEPRNHFDDVRDRHGTDLVLVLLGPLSGHVVPVRLGQELLAGETLDMRQIPDLDATGRAGLGTS
jgi:hypothetical protein